MVRHYEAILLFAAGFRVKEVRRILGLPRSTAYNYRRMYLEAGHRLRKTITYIESVSPREKNKLITPDDLRAQIDGLDLRELNKIKGWITRKQGEENEHVEA